MTEIGDIFEISLASGFGYAKVTHLHRTYLDVLMADPQIYAHRLHDPSNAEFKDVVLYPLSQSIKGGNLNARKCISDPNASGAQPFPRFRFAVRDRRGEPIYWWIWNGDSIVPADPDQDISDLPIRKILSQEEFIGLWRT